MIKKYVSLFLFIIGFLFTASGCAAEDTTGLWDTTVPEDILYTLPDSQAYTSENGCYNLLTPSSAFFLEDSDSDYNQTLTLTYYDSNKTAVWERTLPGEFPPSASLYSSIMLNNLRFRLFCLEDNRCVCVVQSIQTVDCTSDLPVNIPIQTTWFFVYNTTGDLLQQASASMIIENSMFTDSAITVGQEGSRFYVGSSICAHNSKLTPKSLKNYVSKHFFSPDADTTDLLYQKYLHEYLEAYDEYLADYNTVYPDFYEDGYDGDYSEYLISDAANALEPPTLSDFLMEWYGGLMISDLLENAYCRILFDADSGTLETAAIMTDAIINETDFTNLTCLSSCYWNGGFLLNISSPESPEESQAAHVYLTHCYMDADTLEKRWATPATSITEEHFVIGTPAVTPLTEEAVIITTPYYSNSDEFCTIMILNQDGDINASHPITTANAGGVKIYKKHMTGTKFLLENNGIYCIGDENLNFSKPLLSLSGCTFADFDCFEDYFVLYSVYNQLTDTNIDAVAYTYSGVPIWHAVRESNMKDDR